jgi:catechol 2,3-dioxygenase-like lactoylglutathione lyase family enzyme
LPRIIPSIIAGVKLRVYMTIRRVVPNIKSDQFEASQNFYEGILGFEVAMQMGWITTFASPDSPTAQVSIIGEEPSGIHPNMSIEVENVDAVHAKAAAAGIQIVYPLTDEPWGVRRFFARDPNGQIVNIVSHHKSDR